MKYLMTHSLINSWLYLFSDFEKYVFDTSEKTADDYQEAAFRDFLSTLRKEPHETTEAMRNGIEFENLVASLCSGEYPGDHKWFDAAQEIARDVTGAQFQVAARKEIEVAGIPLLLYGRLDCLKAGTISDIKYTSRYEVGKFFSSPQHHIYMELVPEAERFTYLVSNGSRVWRETYTRSECKPASEIIEGFLAYLTNTGLLSVYTEHWKARE